MKNSTIVRCLAKECINNHIEHETCQLCITNSGWIDIDEHGKCLDFKTKEETK